MEKRPRLEQLSSTLRAERPWIAFPDRMQRRRILLAQLPIPPIGPEPLRGNVPLAAGYLKLVARRAELEESFSIDILPAAIANESGDAALVDAICAREPELLGFTCYLWNVERTLWIARRVKERRPGLRVIVGGPEITTDNEWVLADDVVDFAVFGEGEQTFVEWLAWLRDGELRDDLRRIAGLGFRDGGSFVRNAPRTPMSDLAAISSPYSEGILDAAEHDQLLLETVRGCIFRCKFCYYPKAYDTQFFLATDHVRRDLAHARARGVKEVFLLDPTLNQRKDFAEFVELLAAANPDGALEFHGELRGEGITPELAQRMRAANFVEVEVGLQSVDPRTQELMDRRNNLRAFETGVKALRDAGIRVKTDLIVGLPGDTMASVHEGFRFLVERGLCDIAQVFRLSILPGTAFRQEAERLGLRFMSRPPYSVLATPTLSERDIGDLLLDAEEAFDCTFDPIAEATHPAWRDRERSSDGPVATLRFTTPDPFADRERMAEAIRARLARDPFATMLVVIETNTEFPFDALDAVLDAMVPAVDLYQEKHHATHTGMRGAARRVAVVLPESLRATIDLAWSCALGVDAELVWNPEPRAREVERATCG